jgi:hypothetical protein
MWRGAGIVVWSNLNVASWQSVGPMTAISASLGPPLSAFSLRRLSQVFMISYGTHRDLKYFCDWTFLMSLVLRHIESSVHDCYASDAKAGRNT